MTNIHKYFLPQKTSFTRYFKVAFIFILLSFSRVGLVQADSDHGVITKKSPHNYTQTQEKFEAILENKGLTLFAKVDHQSNAAKVDLELRPTTTYIFGNPKVGTPLMQCKQQVALDLPQKMIVYENDKGEVYLAYNDPKYLASRHQVSDCGAAFEKVVKALEGISNATIQ